MPNSILLVYNFSMLST